jgi:SNF2 family DNA or RNA helicase
VQFQALKRLAARGKWKSSVDWLKEALESNGKMIVFAVHHETIDRLMEDMKDFQPVKVDGRDSQEKRQAAVDRFQNDETCRLFVGNIKAAGIGLTLTEASAVVFLELGWTPGEHVQAEDRPHRIGQTKSVNVYYLVAADTVEEEIAALLDKKQKVLDAVLDGAETDQDSLLSELLKRYMEQSRS